MRIGYPCINRTVECLGGKTFRLKSYSEKRLVEAVENNLRCLERVLRWNAEHGIGFFRISSDLVPFASHPVCTYPWERRFRADFARIGRLIRRSRMRISMHPDQFVLINAVDEHIALNSVQELEYQVAVLDLLGLSCAAKIQVHVGGVYGDRDAAIERFARRYRLLPEAVRRRLVIENDDVSYPVADCLRVHELTGVPVLFDSFHHAVNNRGEPLGAALAACAKTWRRRDGIPMCDYSSQEPGGRRGKHAEHIDLADFRRFLRESRPADFDVMLEIKDKERSALAAIGAAARDPRLAGP
ncbi:MAG: UV DNA damage repair endonuclease UvsE [bacterium]